MARKKSQTVASELRAVAKVLARARRALLTMHRSPDGDALGSALALAHILRGAGIRTVVCADRVPERLQFLPGTESVRRRPPRNRNFSATIACDAGDPARLSGLPAPARRG